MAIWSGVLFGSAEGINAWVRRRIQHLPTGEYAWHELLWMPPVAAVVSLVLLALLAIVGDRLLRSRGHVLRIVPSAVVTLAAYSAIRSVRPGIAGASALILALGCAVGVTRVPLGLLQSVRRAARWQLPSLAILLTIWIFGVPFYRQQQEQQAHKNLPTANAGAPNVLLIIWDTARALSLSLYGHTRATTPELDRLAQGGTVFQHAFAASSWSLPSHAAMYTGRDAHEIDVGRTVPLDATDPTLAEVLSRYGYVTGGFTGNLFYGSRDFGIARGFHWYDDEANVSVAKIATRWRLIRRAVLHYREMFGVHQSLVRRGADDVSEDFLRWVDRRGKRPFFASVNYFDAHHPYLAPPPFNSAFSRTPPRYWTGPERPTDPALLTDLETAYEQCIRYLDHETAKLIEALRQRGVLDNTLVIITSDHGEQFGDHGARLQGHERSLYASVLRVPLVMLFPPKIPAGARRQEPVSIRDIPATVMDVLGLAQEDEFPGVSLAPHADARASAEQQQPRLSHLEPNNLFGAELEWANKEQHRLSIVSGKLHYLLDRRGREELFDYVSDPWETTNLVNETTMADSLTRFRAMIDSVDRGVSHTRRR